MRTLTCKHKICERKLVHWSPDFIVLHVFNYLETCRPYKLMTNLEIDKFLKKSIKRLSINYHICRCRPNYIQKWQQEHLNARSSIRFFFAIGRRDPHQFCMHNFKWHQTIDEMKLHSQSVTCSSNITLLSP